MAQDIDQVLGAFAEDDYTARLARAVCAAMPFGPLLSHAGSLAEVLKQADPKAKRPVLDRATEIAASAEFQSALWVLGAIDTADAGITAFSGLKTAYKLYKSQKGERLDALETDQAQAADAVVKGLAIAMAIYKLFPGGPLDKVKAFRALPSGQGLALYYAAIEVGLPFTDNALTAGGQGLSALYAKFGPQQVDKLRAVAGDEAADGATAVMTGLAPAVDGIVGTAAGALSAVAGAVTEYLPKIMDVGDKAAGVLASGVDAMPVYRYLGTRLVAEAAVARALAEQTVAAAESSKNPALDEIKFTTKKPDRDEVQVPAPKKRGGCLFFVMLLGVGAATLAGSAAYALG